jgi:hypothetical protein
MQILPILLIVANIIPLSNGQLSDDCRQRLSIDDEHSQTSIESVFDAARESVDGVNFVFYYKYVLFLDSWIPCEISNASNAK